MLNLFTNTNNFSLFDNNLLSFGLILGSFSVIGYTIFHFSVIFNSNINKDIPNLLDAETITHSVVNNLKSQPITGSNTVVPKLSNETLESLFKSEGRHLTESAVQTDEAMTYDYLRELIYNMGSVTQSLGEISPTEFVSHYRNDPALAPYFDRTAQWAESISRQSSSSSANSEIIFLRKIGEDIKSITELIENNLSSEIVNSNITSPVAEIPQGSIDELKMSKFDEIMAYLSQNYPQLTGDPVIKDWVQNMINSYDYDQLLLLSINSEIINKINCNIILWSCGMF
jgi:hypothetical protein